MGQSVVAVATLLVIGTIIATLVFNAKGTASVLNSIGGLWMSGLQGAAGQKISGAAG